jgi:hypothetical protein
MGRLKKKSASGLYAGAPRTAAATEDFRIHFFGYKKPDQPCILAIIVPLRSWY